MHADAPELEIYLPAAQLVHTIAPEEEYFPATQLEHAKNADAPVVEE